MSVREEEGGEEETNKHEHKQQMRVLATLAFAFRVVSVVAAASQSENAASWNMDFTDRQGLDGEYTWDFTGKGVRLYVVDTGVASENEEFADVVVRKDVHDVHGHGTFVASVVSGRTWGLAPGVDEIVSVRILNSNGQGSMFGLFSAFAWIEGDVASSPRNVINLSIQTAYFEPADTWVERLTAKENVVVVGAAGNRDVDACTTFPGGTRNKKAALSVGSCTREREMYPTHNWGACVDLWAPGEMVSGVRGNDPTESFMTGTSAAAPHVSAVVAMNWEKHPTFSGEEIVRRVLRDAEHRRLIGCDVSKCNVGRVARAPCAAEIDPFVAFTTSPRGKSLAVSPRREVVLTYVQDCSSSTVSGPSFLVRCESPKDVASFVSRADDVVFFVASGGDCETALSEINGTYPFPVVCVHDRLPRQISYGMSSSTIRSPTFDYHSKRNAFVDWHAQWTMSATTTSATRFCLEFDLFMRGKYANVALSPSRFARNGYVWSLTRNHAAVYKTGNVVHQWRGKPFRRRTRIVYDNGTLTLDDAEPFTDEDPIANVEYFSFAGSLATFARVTTPC